VFAQVLQLTYGAENRALRKSSTLPALEALARAGLITGETRATLSEAYVFLRTLEHRLQIVQEQQTHALSRAERELQICARRMGLADASELERVLEGHRGRVHEIWSGLFERRPGGRDWRSRQWYRVLADEASAEEVAALLAEHGWSESDAAAAIGVVRALEEATVLAPSRSMARNVLANLLPSLLDRVALCARPLQALIRLEQVTERTGAAAGFFRTLLEDEALRDRLIATLDLGELAASRLVRHSELLDSLMQPRPELDELGRRWRSALGAIAPGERAAEIRRFHEVEEWKVLVDCLTGGETRLAELQERLTLLAECSVAAAAQWADPASGARAPIGSSESAPVAGAEPSNRPKSAKTTKKSPSAGESPKRVRGAKAAPATVTPAIDGDWVILALGKLGGRELTVHSDLDLVMVYRGDPADSTRFMAMQEMATSFERMLEEPTAAGIAYHVDTRLRPEGKKGALAMPLVAFERYLRERAEIWERLAWTRYRSIAGSTELAARVEEAICAFVYGPWDERIPTVMGDIRRRMERELAQPGGPHLEFKIGRGGLSDVDFAVEMIQMREGAVRPELRVPGTRRALALLGKAKWIEPGELDDLTRGYHFLRRLELFARLDVDAGLSAVPADAERLAVLGRRLGLEAPAGDRLAETFASVTERVREIYEAVLARL
jgi:glutamate-ammonia-ligase adenylyltransferase